MVGLGAAQLGGQGTVGVGAEHEIDLPLGEPGGFEEGGPAVVLAGLGDGLVLRHQLSDGPPALLLGGDGLVRGQLGADVLEHPVQDGPGGGVGVVGGVRGDMRVVCGVGGDVGVVPVPAAGHRDVEGLPRGRRRHDRVRGVDRDALGAVPGDRIPEFDLFGDVGGGEHE